MTPEEKAVLFQRNKENRKNRWRPLPLHAPRYSTAEKNKWWYKPENKKYKPAQ